MKATQPDREPPSWPALLAVAIIVAILVVVKYADRIDSIF